MFPMPKQNKAKVTDVPEEFQVYKNLYMLFKGDIQKMEWFYNNRTEADLMLMIFIHNATNSYDD
jgi:hypothetical protein